MTEAELTRAEGGWLEPAGLTNELGELLKHGAGVEVATSDPRGAYSRFGKLEPSAGPDRPLP